MIIGICGKSGSGKSTLSRILTESIHNTVYLDIDKVGHNVLTLEEVKKELIKNYGNDILSDNSVDRKKLREIVFNSSSEMKKLSDITWKYMQIDIEQFLLNNKDRVVILDWLLLPLSNFFEKCDIKILLDVPYEIRKQRVIERDNISEEMFELREKSSINYDKGEFDYVFKYNNKDELIEKLKHLIIN